MRETRTVEELEDLVRRAAEAGDFREAQKLQRELERTRARLAADSEKRAQPEDARRSAAAAQARSQANAPAAQMQANRRLTTIAGASIAVAIAATAIGGFSLVRSQAALARVEGDLVSTVVATTDIAPGSVLSEGDLALEKVPRAFAPDDAAKDAADLIGKKTITAQSAGVPVALSSVATSSSPASLPAAVGEGKLGLMVSLESDAAASPLLSIGDRVDVLGTTSDGAATVTETLASDVRVLALDGRLEGGGEDGYTLVTLELDPEAASRVAASGDLHLAVRPTSTEGEAR